MTKVIEFEGLRTSTSFNFKNKKERAEYWDELLKNSALRFKNEYSRFLHEKLHVFFSLVQIFKIFSILCVFLTLSAFINSNEMLFIVNGILTFIFLCLFVGYHLKFKSFVIGVIITEKIHTIEFIEALQEIVKSEDIK
ncbi:MAG: hypothetical protein WC554_12565 [Clostridia bacterium]